MRLRCSLALSGVPGTAAARSQSAFHTWFAVPWCCAGWRGFHRLVSARKNGTTLDEPVDPARRNRPVRSAGPFLRNLRSKLVR